MTETKTYKKNQRQRHTDTDKDKYKVLPRPNVCYIYQKQGVQGFKILYCLSSCDDKELYLSKAGGSMIKYYIGYLLVKTKTKTKCFQDPMNAIFFLKAGGARI